MTELTYLSAVTLADAIRKKKISPIEVVDAHLARIEKLNPALNAFVQVDLEGARCQARAAEQAVSSAMARGPLDGVPISIKNSIEVAGFRCEAGTKLRAGYIASQDAPLVRRLRNAGAIILGVTNT